MQISFLPIPFFTFKVIWWQKKEILETLHKKKNTISSCICMWRHEECEESQQETCVWRMESKRRQKKDRNNNGNNDDDDVWMKYVQLCITQVHVALQQQKQHSTQKKIKIKSWNLIRMILKCLSKTWVCGLIESRDICGFFPFLYPKKYRITIKN